MRRIKNYKNMSKEGLLIALLKLERSLVKNKSNNAKIKETKKNFNELRNKFSKSKVKKIRKEKIEQYFNELEKKKIKRRKKYLKISCRKRKKRGKE